MESLRAALAEKIWFGFDLDDTLHEFRKASSTAAVAVFTEIHLTYQHTKISDLKELYSSILKQSTANAFVDRRTSTEYRKERFNKLLLGQNLPCSEEELEHLALVYKEVLAQALELKAGALNLLRALHRLGKKVIVITEGPKDAQEWTLQELNLSPYVDVVITTNEMGLSKTDRLFEALLERFKIDASKMVYFGDSYERDIVPAKKAGLLAIHYDESTDCQLEQDQGDVRVDSLLKICSVLNIKV